MAVLKKWFFENINCIISLTIARDMVQIFTKVEKQDEHSGNTIAQVRELWFATSRFVNLASEPFV